MTAALAYQREECPNIHASNDNAPLPSTKVKLSAASRRGLDNQFGRRFRGVSLLTTLCPLDTEFEKRALALPRQSSLLQPLEAYDGNDMLTDEELVVGGSKAFDIRYQYNAYGHMYRKYLPSGKGISYYNDGLGRHKKVSWGTGPNSIYADGAEYHPSGALETLTFGNGQVFSQYLTDRLQPQQLKVSKDGIDMQNLSYDYYADGRVKNKTNNLDSTYSALHLYDSAGRLKEATSTAWGAAKYTYDPLGNLQLKEFNNNGAIRTVTNAYDSKNRIYSSIDTANIGYGFVHDARGNVVQTGGLLFDYDMSDQPVAMSPLNGTGKAPNTNTQITASYLYDGNMKRVRSIVDTGSGPKTIYNVYDASGQLVHVDEETDGIETDYLHGMGQTLARIKDSGTGDVFTYLHPDHLGSPQVGTDGITGAVEFTEHYTPFGEALLSPAANNNQSGFTGHIKDKSTGLNYMQARYYDPNIGRFLSVDPVTFLDTGQPSYFNRYSYTANDPINAIDPDGRKTFTLGLDVDVVFGVGGGGSAGIYFNSGLQEGQSFDIGFYKSKTKSIGADVSFGFEAGMLNAPASALSGQAFVLEGGLVFAEAEIALLYENNETPGLDAPSGPIQGEFAGGKSFPEISGQIGIETTTQLSLVEAVGSLMDTMIQGQGGHTVTTEDKSRRFEDSGAYKD